MRAYLLSALMLAILTPLPSSAQSALAAPAAQAGGGSRAVNATLSPGDAVRISVWRKPELSGDYIVTADGMIASPFYMDVHVTGIPLSSVAERVRLHVARFESEPRVLVEPLLRVSVSGEVRQPNLYSVSPETTIAQVVMQAGGPTSNAQLQRVVVWRSGQELHVDLTRPDIGLAGTPIQSRDQILVARRTSVLRDYIAPASSIIGAVAAITSAILRSSR
jgi:protein involved in polysaccharide export with SLBB domain